MLTENGRIGADRTGYIPVCYVPKLAKLVPRSEVSVAAALDH